MPRADYYDITLVLDRSGSMSACAEATVRGVNDFIRSQKGVPGDGCWTLVRFDDEYEVVWSQLPQDSVPLLTAADFVPRGGTAVVDAVCRAVDDTGKRLAATPEHLRPSGVLFVIMTDGQENASSKFTARQLNDRISHQRSKYSWTFLFLAANQDAIATAAGYGIPRGTSLTYAATPTGSATAFFAISKATSDWKQAGGSATATPLFGDADRDANSPDKKTP